MSGVLKGVFFAAMASAAMFATGCGNVCDDAADICGGGDSADGAEAECEGAVEEFAQCIVDADSCSAETVAECAGAGG